MKEKREQISVIAEIKKTVKDTFVKTTAHGFPGIIINNLLIFKLMWLFCLLFSCAGCAYLLQKSVVDYLSYDVVTTIREHGETPSTFPAVSICATNLVVNSKMQIYVDTLLQDQNIRTTATSHYEIMSNYLAASLSSPSFNDTYRASMGLSFDEFVIQCNFNKYMCKESIFWLWYFDGVYGNCFRFNGGVDASGAVMPLLKSTKAGKWNGLSLL
jgi:hypothetical protein